MRGRAVGRKDALGPRGAHGGLRPRRSSCRSLARVERSRRPRGLASVPQDRASSDPCPRPGRRGEGRGRLRHPPRHRFEVEPIADDDRGVPEPRMRRLARSSAREMRRRTALAELGMPRDRSSGFTPGTATVSHHRRRVLGHHPRADRRGAERDRAAPRPRLFRDVLRRWRWRWGRWRRRR